MLSKNQKALIGVTCYVMFLTVLVGRVDSDDDKRRSNEAREQIHFQRKLKRLSGVCDSIKDKKLADLTTHDEELIRACNQWDVPTIEQIAPPGWWDKLRGL